MSGESEEGWTTLDGIPMQPVIFESMSDAKDFNKRYENVSNFEIAGNTNYVAQFIAEEWPDRIEYDRSLIKTANIDIEVFSADGFPAPEDAAHPITAICMVSLRYHDEGFIDTFDRQIRALSEVQECYHMAGKVDFFLKINLQSLDAYHEFVRLKLSKIDNIGVLESSFVLKEIFHSTEYNF